MNLARELTIKTIEVQKRHIQKKLEECADSRNGRVMFTYYGELYPEVKDYFEGEGFRVVKWNNQTNHPYAYVFTVDQMYMGRLTEEEKIKAIEYANECEQKNKIKDDLDLL